jgi:tripartite ATP-independent transporter DctP family solute receptor
VSITVLLVVGGSSPAVPGAEAVFTVRWSDAWDTSNPNAKADAEFVDALNSQSQGRLKVTLYPANQLGGPATVIPAVQNGSIQVMTLGASNLSQYVPLTGGLSLPFLFPDEAHAFRALDGRVGQTIAQELLRQNFVELTWYFSGFGDFFNVVRPIRDVQDVRGLRLRVVNDPIQIAMVHALGAIPVPLDSTEVYTALQNHVVDGVINAPAPTYSSQWSMVTRYESIVNAVLFVNVVAMNKSFYDRLPADLQQLFVGLAPTFSKRQRSYAAENEAVVAKAIVAQGNAVNTLTPAALQAFRAAVAPVYDEAKKRYGSAFVAALEAAGR